MEVPSFHQSTGRNREAPFRAPLRDRVTDSDLDSCRSSHSPPGGIGLQLIRAFWTFLNHGPVWTMAICGLFVGFSLASQYDLLAIWLVCWIVFWRNTCRWWSIMLYNLVINTGECNKGLSIGGSETSCLWKWLGPNFGRLTPKAGHSHLIQTADWPVFLIWHLASIVMRVFQIDMLSGESTWRK